MTNQEQAQKNAANNAETARIIRLQLDTLAGYASIMDPGQEAQTALLVAGDLLCAARERLAQAIAHEREVIADAQARQQAAVETLADDCDMSEGRLTAAELAGTVGHPRRRH